MYNACSDSKIPQNITFQPTTALSVDFQKSPSSLVVGRFAAKKARSARQEVDL